MLIEINKGEYMKEFKTDTEKNYEKNMEKHLEYICESKSYTYIANNFAKYVKRQELSRFLFRHELFKKILHMKGSIIECGVHSGNGIMSWAQLTAILEPMGFFRRIFGFDTFSGFPSVHMNDLEGAEHSPKKGDLNEDCYDDLINVIKLFNQNRFLPQFEKVNLIKGDFLETGEIFIQQNPHLLVALLYLDFDLYEPTKKALEIFLPRMCKGSILGFDEINNPLWPGETKALLESLDIRQVQVKKFPYEPNMAYVVL